MLDELWPEFESFYGTQKQNLNNFFKFMTSMHQLQTKRLYVSSIFSICRGSWIMALLFPYKSLLIIHYNFQT